VTRFETVADLLAAVDREAEQPSRFPARFVLVSGTDAWHELIVGLRLRADVCVPLSECCSGDDVLPYLDDVLARLARLGDERALLLPMSELLRLQSRTDSALCRLAELERPGRQRIYVPLLGARDAFEAGVAPMDRYLSGDLHPGWHLSCRGAVTVTMAEVVPAWRSEEAVRGLRAYLRRWEDGLTGDCFVVTALAPYLTDRAGAVALTAYRSPWHLARACLGGLQDVPQDWGSDAQWRWLLAQARQGDELATLAARRLAVADCSGEQLFAGWRDRSQEERWLAWLWAKTAARRDTYVGLVAEESSGEGQVMELAATAVLGRHLEMEHRRQRRRLLEALGAGDMPAAFWRAFAALERPLERLRALAGLSERERQEIVRAVGDLITADHDVGDWLPLLELSYPELAHYLTSFPYGDADVEEYFRLYTRSRVCDRPLPGLLEMARELARRRRVWDFPTRGSSLEQEQASDRRVLWFDAVGLEWAGLLAELLRSRGFAVRVRVCRANLPTTTPHNSDWDSEKPPRQMDQEAHRYDYSHPASLVREISLVASFANRVGAALEEAASLLVTADHGLTRFAGAGERVAPPDGARVHHRGRYAELPPGVLVDVADAPYCVYGDKAVFAVHGLFAGGSDSIGEVHGGATLEECLVPVMLVESARAPEAPISVTVVDAVVRLDARGQGVLRVKASGVLAQPSLVLLGMRVAGDSVGPDIWGFSLRGLTAGEHHARLESGGRIIASLSFETQRGIIEDDLGL